MTSTEISTATPMTIETGLALDAYQVDSFHQGKDDRFIDASILADEGSNEVPSARGKRYVSDPVPHGKITNPQHRKRNEVDNSEDSTTKHQKKRFKRWEMALTCSAQRR